ncbi:MAG: acyl-CoA reductase, partial [Longimicrobiales bacterium]
YWPGGTTGLEEALLREADTSIVYGSRDVVSLARTSAPLNARLVIHGPRLSLGLVLGQNLDLDQIDAIAADAAGAVATFDQQGCVSPHAIFVLGPMAAAHDLATGLARALHQLEHRLPRGRMTPGEAVAMLDARARAEFQAIAGRNIVLYSGREAPYTVVLDADEGFEASCLNRFITVRPLAAVERLTELLRPLADVLQSIALAGFTEEETIRLAPVLGGLGISRITSFRALPWPPPAWHHDGSEPLRELIRWIDLEI